LAISTPPLFQSAGSFFLGGKTIGYDKSEYVAPLIQLDLAYDGTVLGNSTYDQNDGHSQSSSRCPIVGSWSEKELKYTEVYLEWTYDYVLTLQPDSRKLEGAFTCRNSKSNGSNGKVFFYVRCIRQATPKPPPATAPGTYVLGGFTTSDGGTEAAAPRLTVLVLPDGRLAGSSEYEGKDVQPIKGTWAGSKWKYRDWYGQYAYDYEVELGADGELIGRFASGNGSTAPSENGAASLRVCMYTPVVSDPDFPVKGDPRPLTEAQLQKDTMSGLRFLGGGSVLLSTPLYAAPRSFACWVRVSGNKEHSAAGVIWGTMTKDKGLNFEITAMGHPRMHWVTDKGELNFVADNVDLRTGVWEHLAFVLQFGKAKLVLNGRVCAEVPCNSAHFNTVDGVGEIGKIKGDIDDLSIWVESLLVEEIVASTSDCRGDATGLLALYRFDEGLEEIDANRILDSGPYKCHGTTRTSVRGDPARLELPACMFRCRWHNCGKHDFFVNYRVATDSGNAERLAIQLEANRTFEDGMTRPIKAFWDQHCLPMGEDWEVGFINGLTQSKVIVLTVSSAAIERIKGADQRQDNVLLEYEYAFDSLDAGRAAVEAVFIMKEDLAEWDPIPLEDFPDTKHKSAKSTPSHPTVRHTMKRLYDLLPTSTCTKPSDLSSAIPRLLQALERRQDPNPLPEELPQERASPTGLRFNGTGGFAELSKPIGSAIWTVECWIRCPLDVSESYRRSTLVTYPISNGIQWQLSLENDGRMVFSVRNSQGSGFEFKPMANMRTGSRQHIAFSFDGKFRIQFYLNGSLSQCKKQHVGHCFEVDQERHLRIGHGAAENQGSQCFDGDIYELRLWSTPRTAEQIRAYMSRPLPPDSPGLLGWYDFDEGQVRDLSPMENHGVLHQSRFSSPRIIKSLPCGHPSHPVYMVYRHGVDDHVAEHLFFRFGGAPEQMFHGRMEGTQALFIPRCCGGDRELALREHLVTATIVVVIITPSTLRNIANAQHEEDPMLLEWEIALERHNEKKCRVVPLLMHENNEAGFQWGQLPEIPRAKHASPRSPAARKGLTIKDTYDALFKINGYQTKYAQLRDRVADLCNLLQVQRILEVSQQISQNDAFNQIEKELQALCLS
jgi:hypothetical protein